MFDGSTPLIKKKTSAKRRQQRRDTSQRFRSSVEKVLLSKFGLKSLEELKTAIQNDVEIQNQVVSFMVNREDEDILSDSDEDEDGLMFEDIDLESDEYNSLNNDTKLAALREVKRKERFVQRDYVRQNKDISPVCYQLKCSHSFLMLYLLD